MYDPLTLYSPPGIADAAVFRFTLATTPASQDPAVSAVLIGYTPQPPAAPLLEGIAERVALFSGDPSERAVILDLVAALEEIVGPLLLLLVIPRGAAASVTLWPSAGFAQPSARALRIAPNEDGFVAVQPSEPVPIGAREHLVVPLTMAAEEALATWYDRLNGFAPELRQLLLATLASPAIDVRLDRIEASMATLAAGIGGPTAAPRPSPRPSTRAWGPRWAVLAAFIGALLGAMVGSWLQGQFPGLR
jgi:hypothetical protein